MSLARPPLQPAVLRWQDGVPEAENFGDIYFSREDGLAESRFVFLQGNRLRERWQALPAGSQFVIGETGFGTGLNFLLAWQLWQQCAPADAELFFISTELHPLTHDDLTRALSHWPELAPFADALLASYPALTPGEHWLRFADSRVTLLLLLGDARETLPQLPDLWHSACDADQPWQVDAWFLDGFAPAKNPQLWHGDVFSAISLLSRPGTTLATFTAAGQVRRDLAALGFKVSKTPGYGRKREMVCAEFVARPALTLTQNSTPWLAHITTANRSARIAVIGAGLAGAHIARTLAQRGLHISVFEQHAEAALEASGNPQGALYTHLSANDAALARFSLASYQYALRHYRQPALRDAFHPCGLLELGEQPDPARAQFFAATPQLATWLDADDAIAQVGSALDSGGWWLPDSGWISPRLATQNLLQHANIRLHYHCPVSRLQFNQPARQGECWQLLDADDRVIGEFDQVIIACANQSNLLAGCDWLQLRPVRGQITTATAHRASTDLRAVLCREGYITPAQTLAGQTSHCFGASFVPGDCATELRAAEQQHNLRLLADISPALASPWQNAAIAGRAALRCTVRDHLPLCGPVPDAAAFARDYAALARNARKPLAATSRYQPGLWLFAAFGGRGLCYIPLAAELLASQLLGTPRPLSRPLQQALAPARLLIRDIARGSVGNAHSPTSRHPAGV